MNKNKILKKIIKITTKKKNGFERFSFYLKFIIIKFIFSENNLIFL